MVYIKGCKTINNSPQIMTGTCYIDITTYKQQLQLMQAELLHHIKVSINQMEIKWSSYEESSEGDCRPFLGGGPAVNDGFLGWSNICPNSSSSSSLWEPSPGVGLAGGEIALIHVDYKTIRTNICIEFQFLIFSILSKLDHLILSSRMLHKAIYWRDLILIIKIVIFCN